MVDDDRRRYDVKPIWIVRYPSSLTAGTTEQKTFTLAGVQRQSDEIATNAEKVQGIEKFNQGWKFKPEDLKITVGVFEQGEEFDKMRLLAKGKVMFDIECDLLRVSSVPVGSRPAEHATNHVPWLKGFEVFLGCIVQRRGRTVDIGEIPIMEFECEALEHVIKEVTAKHIELKEGDGSYPALVNLGI
jgi:hypothetical protein